MGEVYEVLHHRSREIEREAAQEGVIRVAFEEDFGVPQEQAELVKEGSRWIVTGMGVTAYYKANTRRAWRV